MEQVTEHTVIRKQLPSIRVYLDGKSDKMGLARYNEVVMPGAFWEEPLTCLEANNQKRYITGLDEFAPEVTRLTDPEKKKAVIKNIREKVAFLERSFAANVLDVDDKDFWNKVQVVRPNNHDFWKDIKVRTGNEPVFLDPENPSDLVILCGIEAGGFTTIAKSFDDARLASQAPNWYLDKEVDTASTKNELKKLKNKAKGSLDKLHEKDSKRLFYIVKNVDPKPYQYTLSTSQEIIYSVLDEYIEGKGQENAKRAATRFTNLVTMPIAELKVRAVLADANFYKMILAKADGNIYHVKTDRMLGGNIEEVIEFYMNQLNAVSWQTLYDEVESRWKL
jgi:hypothetical protein